MRVILLLAFFSLIAAPACHGTEIPIFDNAFMIETYGDPEGASYVFFVPHCNEQNGVQAARSVLGHWNCSGKAVLHVLRNCNERVEDAMKKCSVGYGDPPGRYLYFSFQGRWYSIDPNRIYTRAGISRGLLCYDGKAWLRREDLRDRSVVPEEVIDAVEKASLKILACIGIDNCKRGAVVAVHNNTPTEAGSLDSFSMRWYENGGPCEGEVARDERGNLSAWEGDPSHLDNLFLVNRAGDFQAVKRERIYNVALLASGGTDDGSLSVLCTRKGIRYINVEAQHMNRNQEMNEESINYQKGMLRLLEGFFAPSPGSGK